MDSRRLRWLALVMLAGMGCRAAPAPMAIVDPVPCTYDRCALWSDGTRSYRGLDSLPLGASLIAVLRGNDSALFHYAQSSRLRANAVRTLAVAVPLMLLPVAALPICGLAGGGGQCGVVLVPALLGHLLNLSARSDLSRSGDALGRALWYYNRTLPRSPAPTTPPAGGHP